MVEEVKEMFREVVDDPEVFSIVARGMKKFHEALRREGFTEEQATTIVASQGFGVTAK